MRLAKALREKLNDVRLRDKFLGEGKLSKDQIDKYLQGLPDDENNVAFTVGLERDDHLTEP